MNALRHTVAELGRRLTALVRPQRVQADLDDEMRLHLDLLRDRYERDGLERDHAVRAARVRFGNSASLREAGRDAAGWTWLTDWLTDSRQAVRAFARHPAHALTAIVSLGLALGATTAVFGVVNGVLLRPLPFTHADRLVQVAMATPLTPDGGAVSAADLNALAERGDVLEVVAGYSPSARFTQGVRGRERVLAVFADRTLFDVLGVAAAAGRTFAAGDGEDVAVVSERFWRQAMSSDRQAVGALIDLDGRPYTVIGVMPDGFQFPYGAASVLQSVAAEARTDVWLPSAPPGQPARGRSSVVGRLRGGVSIAAAESALSAIARGRQASAPDANPRLGIRVTPLADVVVGRPLRRVLALIFVAVAVVLALAVVNLTNLSLVRLTTRGPEMAVRTALGAGRARIARQLLAESLIVSGCGALLGLAIAWWALPIAVDALAPRLARARDVSVDWRVLCFGAGIALVAGAIVAAVQSWALGRAGGAGPREGAAWSTGSRGLRLLRDGLVALEVALAFTLAVGAAVLGREMVRLRQTDAGMTATNVLTMHLAEPRETPPNPLRFEALASEVGALPGVRAAAIAQMLPLQNWGWTSNSTDFRVRGQAPTPHDVYQIALRFVTPQYFRALDIAVRRGRVFADTDTPESPMVVVINEALARRAFGDRDPVGVETTRGRIIGVVADVRQAHLDRPAEPEVYTVAAQNWSQVPELGMSLIVRSDGRPEDVRAGVERLLRGSHPELAVFNVRTIEEIVSDSLADFRLALSLLGVFAGLAVVLALTGAYGVIAHASRSRVREFAIRMALGANRGAVMRLVLAQAAIVTGAGLVAGAGLTAALTPLLSGLPVTIRPPDAAIALPIAAAVAVVAGLACLGPARRAARVDPASALRAV